MINWVQENWAQIGVVFLATIRLAEAIVEVTETKKDDQIVAKVKEIILHFFGFTSHKKK